MAARFETKPPAWFWIVAILLLIWEMIGCYFCLQQFRLGAAAMGPPTAYDVALYAALPAWYNWVYALAVGTGALGGLALLGKKASAKPLYVVSLIALVVQFAWLFGTTDLIAAKGVWTTYFPAFIAAVGVFAIWVANVGIRRGWLR